MGTAERGAGPGQEVGLMALFYGQACQLCGVNMTHDDRRFATSHFLPSGSDLWRFSDAVMYWDCYARWEHRARFAQLYFDAKREWSGQNPYWGVAHSDDRLLVTVNPDRLVAEADVMLAETGSGFRVPLADWHDWLAGGWAGGCRHETERQAMASVLPLLLARLPTAEAVVRAAGMAGATESAIAEAGGMVARASHEFACQRLAERAASRGVTCPGCGTFSTDYDHVRVAEVSASGPQSHLKCRGCGEEFGPLEV
jgi:hypothetical protein